VSNIFKDHYYRDPVIKASSTWTALRWSLACALGFHHRIKRPFTTRRNEVLTESFCLHCGHCRILDQR
jgi:hypothetical protein